MNIQAIAAVGETVAAEVKLFRSAAVTSENRATPLARSILAALVAGSATPALVESMVIHAFGNPKTPKGKAITGLTGSGDYLPGWGATRKTVASIFDIFANVDTDAPKVQEEGQEPIGAGECRRLVVSFILNEGNAPKSLRALRDAVKAAVAAHAALLSPDNADAVEESEEERKAEAGESGPSLTERVNALTVAYGAASPEERLAAHDALAALFDAVNADIRAAGDAEEPEAVEPKPELEAAE
jgi:hypothetical protein